MFESSLGQVFSWSSRPTGFANCQFLSEIDAAISLFFCQRCYCLERHRSGFGYTNGYEFGYTRNLTPPLATPRRSALLSAALLIDSLSMTNARRKHIDKMAERAKHLCAWVARGRLPKALRDWKKVVDDATPIVKKLPTRTRRMFVDRNTADQFIERHSRV